MLTDDEVQAALVDLPGWSIEHVSPRRVVKEFRFPGFAAAIHFVDRVAERAERADHHPDLDIRFSMVRVALSTHSAGGVTDLDVALAREIEALA